MLELATKFAPKRPEFEQAWQAGYRHAELWLDGRLLYDPHAIVELAEYYLFQYALHFPNRAELDDLQLSGAVGLYRALKCPAMVTHQSMFDRYAERLSRIAGCSMFYLCSEPRR